MARGTGDAQAVKTYYMDLNATAKVCARARVMRQSAGVLSGYALGEDDGAAPRNVIADVLSAFGPGEAGLHWQAIADRLSARYPERWTGATAESVSGGMPRPRGAERVRQGGRGRAPGMPPSRCRSRGGGLMTPAQGSGGGTAADLRAYRDPATRRSAATVLTCAVAAGWPASPGRASATPWGAATKGACTVKLKASLVKCRRCGKPLGRPADPSLRHPHRLQAAQGCCLQAASQRTSTKRERP